MNLKIYSLKIYDYNSSYEPEVERYVRYNDDNFKYLKKECENYWDDEDGDFTWDIGTNYGLKYWNWNDGDCCYACISEEIVYMNADKSTTQETE